MATRPPCEDMRGCTLDSSLPLAAMPTFRKELEFVKVNLVSSPRQLQ